ncbi:MAG: filamentous hemagglutinin N-terminal domain-containing protein [Cyanophyceae cyanobacterium]
MKKSLFFLAATFILCLTKTRPAQAQSVQVNSDGTLQTNVKPLENNNFSITGGRRKGNNLFHSFDNFSLPNGGSALFKNATDIQNIISRVTGGLPSNINGLVKAEGNANLLLINPSGIVFGPNASLKIGGSFLASTASGLTFKDSTFFDAINVQDQPQLTISVPTGLQFGENPRSITNLSQAIGSFVFADVGEQDGVPVGLQVQPGKTIALVGGDVFLEGGILTAQEGRVEIGSIASSSPVSLKPTSEGWTIKYENVQDFGDIQLSQGAFVNTSGNGAGAMQFHGKKIEIIGRSNILAFNFGVQPGRNIMFDASESLELSGESSVSASTFGDQSAGDIRIEAGKLIIRDNAAIEAQTESSARGGNITVDADESIEISGGSALSRISTQSSGSGRAGNIIIDTEKLSIIKGGQLDSSAFETGSAGTIQINSSKSVEVSGQSLDESTSGLFVLGETPAPAGDLRIDTEQLVVKDGAKISVANTGGGRAGTLKVSARSAELDRGTLTAETSSGDGGNIDIKLQELLLLRNNSLISTTAGTEGAGGDGGDINIDTNLLVAIPSENSDIRADAFNGSGGNITITAQGIFGIEEREEDNPLLNDITASSQFGLDGIVEINTPEAELNEERAELPQEVINVARIIDRNLCATGHGGSEFSVTGRGGLPESPNTTFSSDDTWEDWRIAEDIEPSTVEPSPDPIQPSPAQPQGTQDTIIEAHGWVRKADGNVILTAQANIATPQGITPPQGCQHLAAKGAARASN